MIEINNTTRSEIDIKLVERVALVFVKHYKKENKEVSIAFVGDTVIKKLNKQYRKKDKVTDILSFPEEGDELGEIVIDFAQIKRQSVSFSKNVKEELIFILVHGLLHLIGYEDKTEEGRLEMEKLGEEFIAQNRKKF